MPGLFPGNEIIADGLFRLAGVDRLGVRRKPFASTAVIPGRCEASNPESRDSGSALRASRNDGEEGLPHHARDEPGLAPRRLYFLFQEAVRFLADIARPRIGPGPAFVVLGAGCLADFVALSPFESETAKVAAGAVDRGFDRAVARFHHAGAAHARDAAVIPDPRRDAVLQPADGAAGDIGGIVEAPRPAAPIALAHQCAFRRIARSQRRTLIVAPRTIEICLSLCRSRGAGGHRESQRHQTRPEQAASPHSRLLSDWVLA